jgi:two-component system, cell cycle sensor histidine kinase and response regulator CckA
LHKLLARQIKRYLGSEAQIPPELEPLIAAVDSAYQQADDDRALLERAMDLASQELLDRYRVARAEVVRLEPAERNLERSISLLQATFESTADGILVVDVDGNVTNYNQRFLDIWKFPRQLVNDSKLYQLRKAAAVQLKEPQGFESRILALNVDLEAESFDVLELKDGRVFERYSRPQRLAGRPVGRVWTFRDITERREMQEHLLRAQRLEAAGRVAGEVAHDFNNLLAPIAGFAELIKLRLPADHPVQQYCDAMITSAQQIAEINEDLLALGRRGHFERHPIDVNELVRDVVGGLITLPEEVHVEASLDPAAFPVLGSAAQLLRVLTNLVSNAEEAMANSGIIRVSTENVYVDQPPGVYPGVEPGEYLRVDVSDTGPGISAELQDRIFDAFFTTKGAFRRRGAGLGLSVVQTVVEDHHGYVTVSSVVGEGTTFSVFLPATREVIVESAPAPIDGGGESILVVDDDQLQRQIIAELLQRLGYHAESAASGLEAISMLHEHEFDLLILDMVMPPGIGGAETYRRAAQLRPGQRAIMLSGYTESDQVTLAQGLGAGTFLRKPVTLAKLAQAVRSELDGFAAGSGAIVD